MRRAVFSAAIPETVEMASTSEILILPMADFTSKCPVTETVILSNS